MLARLKIHTLRNLTQVDIELGKGFNLFCGPNGSGKSSLLEAIHFLGLGRSFRTRHVNRIIQEGAEQFTVFGELQQQDQTTMLPVGIERSRQHDGKLQIAHERVDSIAEIANLMPLQLIYPDGHHLLNAGPKVRRQFLDWGLFHVEHSFLPTWKRLQRALRQRNAALRQGAPVNQLTLWDDELLTASQVIDQQRQTYLEALWPRVAEILPKLLAEYQLSYKYYPGWDHEQPLAEVLLADRARDAELGYTQHGPHRAELRLYANGVPAKEILSQGQQKLLVYALRLAQGLHLRQSVDKSCLYLVDDLTSELDHSKVAAVIDVLADLDAQVLLTCVEPNRLHLVGVEGAKMFHVEHGEVKSGHDWLMFHVEHTQMSA